jgi:hypothetical protein
LNGTLPEGPERAEVEILAQIDRADTLGLLKGWGAEEVGIAAQRALELCRQTGNQTALRLTLFQVRQFHQVRSQFRKAISIYAPLCYSEVAASGLCRLNGHRAAAPKRSIVLAGEIDGLEVMAFMRWALALLIATAVPSAFA